MENNETIKIDDRTTIEIVNGITLLFLDGRLAKTHLTEQEINNFTKTQPHQYN